jgi:hypothetical protein
MTFGNYVKRLFDKLWMEYQIRKIKEEILVREIGLDCMDCLDRL